MLGKSLTKLCRIQTTIAIAVFHPAALHRVRAPHGAHVGRVPMHLLTRPEWSNKFHARGLAMLPCATQMDLDSESLVPGDLILHLPLDPSGLSRRRLSFWQVVMQPCQVRIPAA